MPVAQICVQSARPGIITVDLRLLKFPIRLEEITTMGRLGTAGNQLGNDNVVSRPIAHERAARFVWKSVVSFLDQPRNERFRNPAGAYRLEHEHVSIGRKHRTSHLGAMSLPLWSRNEMTSTSQSDFG